MKQHDWLALLFVVLVFVGLCWYGDYRTRCVLEYLDSQEFEEVVW